MILLLQIFLVLMLAGFVIRHFFRVVGALMVGFALLLVLAQFPWERWVQ